MSFTKKPYGWPARETTGVDRSIGVNGTTRSTGGQPPFANWGQKGDLGTSPSAPPFVGGANTNQNRTGEG
jgi:hypothetical protein